MLVDIGEWTVDILEEHFEELGFLWSQRLNALRSPEYTVESLARLDGRIAAHADGLALAGEAALPVIEEGLLEEEAPVAFAAAFSLLLMGTEEASRRVHDRFLEAGAEGSLGIGQAMSFAPIGGIEQQLQQIVTSGENPRAVLAADALACHGMLDAGHPRVRAFLADPEPHVRVSGWRLTTRLQAPRDIAMYRAGLGDPDAEVQREALAAAAWARQEWLADHCRGLAGRPGPEQFDAIHLLATVGGPDEVDRIRGAARVSSLGPRRFMLLGTLGHPSVVDDLLAAIQIDHPPTAVAAGAAFTKITGMDIDSGRRTVLPPEDGSEPDEFEREFLDEVSLPSWDLASRHWETVKGEFSEGSRWCRGRNISEQPPGEAFAQMDLESRWEAHLRARFTEGWEGGPTELEALSVR